MSKEPEELEDNTADEYDDTDYCNLCGDIYCTCCGCDCWRYTEDGEEEAEEDNE